MTTHALVSFTGITPHSSRGLGAALTRGVPFTGRSFASTAGASSALKFLAAQSELNQVYGLLSPQIASERVQVQISAVPEERERHVQAALAIVPQATAKPVSTASTAVVKSDAKPAQAAEPKKSLFQTLTQRKVIITAGIILGVVAVGGAAAAAYYFYPVATAAHAATLGHAGRAIGFNMHQLLIRPGYANTLFLANLALKAAIVPAAKAGSIVMLPALGTAVGVTAGIFVLLFVANKIWNATRGVICSGASFVANKFDEQLSQNLLGKGIKWLCGPIVSTAVSPVVALMADAPTPGADEELSQIEGSVGPTVQEIDDAEAKQIQRAQKPKRARAKKAQPQPQSGVLENVARVTVLGAIAAGVFFWYSKSNATG